MTPTLPSADELEVVAKAKKFELWFFRDISSDQRLKLFSIYGLPVEEIGDSHGNQKLALKHCLPLSSAQAQIEAVREANEALMKERASLIKTKREQMERLTRERDEALERIGAINERALDDVSNLTMRAEAAEVEVKRLREAISKAERAFNNIRGAIESNQVVDKDAHGTAVRARDDARTALSGGTSNG